MSTYKIINYNIYEDFTFVHPPPPPQEFVFLHSPTHVLTTNIGATYHNKQFGNKFKSIQKKNFIDNNLTKTIALTDGKLFVQAHIT